MAHRKEEKARLKVERLRREAAESARQHRQRVVRIALWAGLVVVVGGGVATLNLLGGLGSDKVGNDGPVTVGSKAPDFKALDVVSDKTMTMADLNGKRTLLFFSEGASCQACLMQIVELEKKRSAMRERDLRLVSVTTDPPDALASVAQEYGITTPLLSDESKDMSSAYGMLGRGGMGHADRDGHAFVVLDKHGQVEWERAYTEMYVPPKDLFEAMS